jgi:hypothetical protein
MLFLAVFCGFLAENYRETIVNKEKAHHYIQNMVADLKADTADLNFSIYYQQLWCDHLDSALQVRIDRLKDINTQDTFYYHFLPFYCWIQTFIQNDNTITQLKAGGFNLIRNEKVVDSINLVYNYYRGVKFATDYNITCYWDIVRKAQELMNLPRRQLPSTKTFQNIFFRTRRSFFNMINRDTSALQYDQQCKRKPGGHNSIRKAIQRKS